MRKLNCSFDRDGVLWTVTGGDISEFPISGWPTEVVRDLEEFPQWAALGNAWAAGWITEQEPGRYFLPYSRCFEVKDETRQALGLPARKPMHISLTSHGDASKSEFAIKAEIRDDKHQSLAGAKYVGPFFVKNQTEAVSISKSVSNLIDLTNNPPRGATSTTDRLLYLGQVKQYAEAIRNDASGTESGSTVTLDKYLDNEEISITDSDSISFQAQSDTPERISLNPTIEDASGPLADIPPGLIDGDRSTAKTFTNQEAGGARKRIVLRPEDLETANEIQTREIVGSNVPKFIENPEAFLPDSVEFDLKDYSDRVKSIDIQVYRSTPYIQLRRKTGNGWLEGALTIKIECLTDETKSGNTSPPVGPTLSSKAYTDLAKKSDDGWTLKDGSWIHTDPQGKNFIDDLAKAGYDPTIPGYQRIEGVLNVLNNLDHNNEYTKYLDPIYQKHLDVLPGFDQEPISERFNGTLKPFQKPIYRWLSGLYKTRRGGLLADEMGLGKTVQVLSHIAHVLDTEPDKPILIVVPLTLRENWMDEMGKFLSPLPHIHRHQGSKPDRLNRLRASKPQIVLVAYETLRRDQLEMARIDWSVVVCDEAQFVKNPTSQRTAVVKALKADQHVALTGTPVENGLIEFWCILDYVAPGLLGTWAEFRTQYERPIVEESDPSIRKELVDKLLAECSPHYRRNLKKDVLQDLPQLRDPRREEVPLSQKQLAKYQEILREAKQAGPGNILGALQKLLQCCAIPVDTHAPLSEQLAGCPKLERTLDVLENIRERGEKVLIFTRFLAVQGVLQRAIVERFGVFPECINGSVRGNRQAVVNQFSSQEGFGILILSHDVAGIGLNVTAANHVIHYTRPWNPAKEDQATCRAHRINQDKPVEVYLPITTDTRYVTIEHALDELLEGKRQLMRDVLFPFNGGDITPGELFASL